MAVFLFGLMQVQAVACVGGEVVTTDDSNSEEVNYYAGTAIPLGVNPFDYDGIRAMNTGSPTTARSTSTNSWFPMCNGSAQVARTGSDVAFVAAFAIMMLGGSVMIVTRRRRVDGDR